MFNPSVAVVILNYNGLNHLRQFLPSVTASIYGNLRVIVADNASTDESVDFVRRHFPSVELLLLQQNFGFADGYNQALSNLDADYYVLLNSDVEVTPNWIEPIISFMHANDRVAACQPKILCYANKAKFEYAGASGGWIDVLGYPFSRGRVFDEVETDNGQYDTISKVFWATGAAFFVRSSVYKSLGGFDASFFAHQEEIDLCWRIHRAGYEVYCCPQSVVYHVGGGTLPIGPQKVFLNFRNNMKMMLKNFTLAEKLWKIPFRILLDWVFAFKALMRGKPGETMAVFKAHTQAFFSKRNATAQLPKRPLATYAGVYGQWVIADYFLKHKRTFSQIVKNN